MDKGLVIADKFLGGNLQEDFKLKEYPELTDVAKKMSTEIAKEINKKAATIKSEMTYKAGFILEELIRFLQEKV